MYQSIQTKLHQIATSEPLHLLLAVESGSRAWGFPSPDSDYDVRAIYIKQPENYLCIDEQKDTFEYIENQWFDVGGWDIRKALRLLRKSNAVLLEWLRSPIVYAQDDEFVHALAELVPQYAQAAPLLHHYRGIARNALSAMDLDNEIRLKKWFYVIRPLLAARWTAQRGGIPPMTLVELLDSVPNAIVQEITDLIAHKAEQDESYRHTLSGSLKRFTRDSADETTALQASAPVAMPSEPLDELFRATLRRVWAKAA